MGCIYVITNAVNGKQYVGQTKQSSWEGRYPSPNYLGSYSRCSGVYNAFAKYGPSAFVFSNIALDVPNGCLDCVEKIEIFRRKTTNPSFGYNIRPGGKNIQFTPEHRKKISEGLRTSSAAIESRKRTAEKLRGRKKSPEHIAALSSSLRRTWKSPELRASQSARLKGRRHGPTYGQYNQHVYIHPKHGEHFLTAIEMADKFGGWPTGFRSIANGWLKQHKGWTVKNG